MFVRKINGMPEEIETKPDGKYLTLTQVDAIKDELNKLDGSADGFLRLLSMIDHYVRVNGTADGEYEALYTVVTTLDIMQSTKMGYDEIVKATFPILSAISIYDYFMLTGVLSAEDIQQFKDGALYPFNKKPGIAKA